MARERNPKTSASEEVMDMEQVRKRLEMLNQRLDNLDSMITAVIERVMSQAITLNITCPRCGKNVEIAIIGNRKPTV